MGETRHEEALEAKLVASPSPSLPPCAWSVRLPAGHITVHKSHNPIIIFSSVRLLRVVPDHDPPPS